MLYGRLFMIDPHMIVFDLVVDEIHWYFGNLTNIGFFVGPGFPLPELPITSDEKHLNDLYDESSSKVVL